jgi:transcriptional regulator with XRE-family HTH domain
MGRRSVVVVSRTRGKLAVRKFSEAVAELRKTKGLAQKDLAEKTHLSRTYISNLEAPNIARKDPSLDVLRRLCQVIATEGTESRESSPIDEKKAFDLVFSALGLEMEYPFEEEAGRPLDIETLLAGTNETWVFTDILAENLISEFRESVIDAMRRGVQFRYFVSTSTEWEEYEKNFRESLGANIDLLREHVMAMECHSPLCVTRIALYDPGQSKGKGTVTIGRPVGVRFMYLQPEQVFAIYRKVFSVFDELRKTPELEHPSLGKIRLLFPLKQ